MKEYEQCIVNSRAFFILGLWEHLRPWIDVDVDNFQAVGIKKPTAFFCFFFRNGKSETSV